MQHYQQQMQRELLLRARHLPLGHPRVGVEPVRVAVVREQLLPPAGPLGLVVNRRRRRSSSSSGSSSSKAVVSTRVVAVIIVGSWLAGGVAGVIMMLTTQSQCASPVNRAVVAATPGPGSHRRCRC